MKNDEYTNRRIRNEERDRLLGDNLLRYQTYFRSLVHPSFIGYLKDEKLIVHMANDSMQVAISQSRKNNLEIGDLPTSFGQGKEMDFKDFIRLIISDSEVAEEYLEAVYKTIEAYTTDSKFVDGPKFKHIEISFQGEDPIGIKPKYISGYDTNLILDEGKELAIDIFSIPQFGPSKEGKKIIGFQGIFPIVNKRRQQYLDFVRQSRRSAVATIMSRNMSHNLGSHSLAKLASPELLSSIRLDISDTLFDDSDSLDFKNQFILGLETSFATPISKDFILAKYFSYCRTRMDFIADVVSSIPTLETERAFFKDILKPFLRNLLLMNTISGLSDFRYEIDFRFSGNGDDVVVAIPNDLLGCHAIYIIIENVIRNCAKHGGGNWKDGICKIVIEICRSTIRPGFFELQIADNSKLELSEQVIKQNLDIDMPILNIENRVRRRAWGMMEIKIAAAYLNKVDIEDIDQYGPENRLVTAITEEHLGRGLGYSLFLRMPSKVLVIDCRLDGIDQGAVDHLADLGLNYVHRSQLERLSSVEEPKFPHRFLVIVLDDIKDQIEYVSRLIKSKWSYLPQRIITNSHRIPYFPTINKEEDILQYLKNKDFFLNLSQLWVDFLLKKHDIREFEILNGFGLDPIRLIRENGTQKFSAMFLNHTVLPTNDDELIYEEIRDEETYETKKIIKGVIYNFVEPLGSLQEETIQSNWSNSIGGELFQLAEACITKVGLLDERIQELALKQTYRGKSVASELERFLIEDSFLNIWRRAGVYIPDREEADLNAENFGWNKNGRKSEFEKILGWLSGHKKSIDFLIVHLGVLEKMTKSCQCEKCIASKKSFSLAEISENELINMFIDRHLQSEEDSFTLIITSGRGEAPNLPDNIPFLNYSLVAQFILENRNKFMLTQLLYSSRTR